MIKDDIDFDWCESNLQAKEWLVKGDFYDWDEAESIIAYTAEYAALLFCQQLHEMDDTGKLPGFHLETNTYYVRLKSEIDGPVKSIDVYCQLEPVFEVV